MHSSLAAITAVPLVPLISDPLVELGVEPSLVKRIGAPALVVVKVTLNAVAGCDPCSPFKVLG